MDSGKSITIIGTGALGSSLLHFFRENRYKIVSIWDSKRGLVRDPKTGEEKTVGRNLPAHENEVGDMIFITTPDDLIFRLSEKLAGLNAEWKKKSVIHCSGNLTSGALDPLKKAGARTASMHPIQTFRKNDGVERLKNIYISIEGNEDITNHLRNLIKKMGSKPLPLTVKQKQSVHIAAVFASNYLVSLLGKTEKFLVDEGVEEGLVILHPLIEQTMNNIFENGIEEALSGPVSRGDEATIEDHLKSLNINDEMKALYHFLGKEAVSIALNSNRIDKEKATKLLDLLE